MESLESLYDIWVTRNPKFEVYFRDGEESKDGLLKKFSDFGTGASEWMEAKGKTFGAGYELYIYAFFLGLYYGKKKPLKGKTDVLGHPIKYWGNLENKKGRKEYSIIREYIFAALVAKTEELDLIKLEKGDLVAEDAVRMLIDNMEEYANKGFYLMKEKLDEIPDFLFKNTGFLDMILDLVQPSYSHDEEIEEL